MFKMHLLNGCKLTWEENLVDFYVESILFKIKTIIKVTLF